MKILNRKRAYETRGTPLSEAVLLRLRTIARRVPEPDLIDALQLSTHSFYRAMAGLPLLNGTIAQIEKHLPEVEAQLRQFV